MPVADHHFFAHTAGAVLDTANADTAHEIVVVDGGHQHLEGSFRIALRRPDGAQQRIEQGNQVGTGDIRVQAGGAGAAAAIEDGAVQLFIRSAQIHQQIEDLVHHLFDAGVGAVDLVDGHHQAQVLLQSLLQDETGLGHAALGGIHQQKNAVDHLQNALHLAAEIGMARGVDDVDLDALVVAGTVFGQNGDAALTLDVAAVHDALSHDLVVAERAALAEHGIHQGGLAMVDMSNDGHVAQIVTNHKIKPLYFASRYAVRMVLMGRQTGKSPLPPCQIRPSEDDEMTSTI